jgi:hypothetical protein
VLTVALPFKFFIFYLEEFFVNGFFSYDFELIIVSSILIFSIFFNYSFNRSFYYNLNLKKKNLSSDYVTYIVSKQNAQDKFKYFCYLLNMREQFLIECFLYVYFFMKIQFVIATISKICLLCYLFKERLIFFFNEYSLINNVKEAFVRIRSVMDRFTFYLLFNKKKSIENNITFFFNFYDLEIFDNSRINFVSFRDIFIYNFK